MRFARSLAAVAALAALAACAENSEPTAAAPSLITFGEPTGSAYGNVGALVWDWWEPIGKIDYNDQYCTGALISPTVFLTAAHCVVDIPAGTKVYVSFEPDLTKRNFSKIQAVSWHWDPGYWHDNGDPHDIAVVILPASATRGLTPVSLPRAGELDQLAAQGALSNQLFVNVGYGVGATRTGIPSFPYDGLRKVSKSEYSGLRQYWLGLLMNINATGEGGDCYGDSGGPKFIDGDPTKVYATVITGDIPCRSTSWDYRLDTPSARAFLGQFVALP
jgi:hypothetical protein